MAALKKEGFVSVINLRLAERGRRRRRRRAAPRRRPPASSTSTCRSTPRTPDPKVVDSFLAAVADKSNQPVFIHCGSANRVGGMWMIKRVLQDKWALDRAQAEAEAIGLRQPAADGVRHRLHQQHKRSRSADRELTGCCSYRAWTAAEFRRHGHALVEWIAEYLERSERYPVLPRVAPGDVVARAARSRRPSTASRSTPSSPTSSASSSRR